MAYVNPKESFETLKRSVADTIKKQFPLEGSKHTLVANKVWVDDNLDPDDIRGQKDAKLKGRTWSVPVRAEFELRDNTTGKVRDRQTLTVAQLPKITRRYSYVVNGNEYQVNNLFRLKSGVYSRIGAGGDIEAQWNLAKGLGFRMKFDPKTKKMTMDYPKGASVPLYPVLKNMGVSDDDLERKWGKEILSANMNDEEEPALRKFYKSFRGTNPESLKDSRQFLYEELGKTALRPDSTKLTLGKEFKKVDGDSLLEGSHKLLRVARREDEPDDRDSLAFKELWSAEDLFSDRLERKHSWNIKRKIKNTLDSSNKIKQVVNPDFFGKPVREFFVNSALSERPDQMNPISFTSGNRRTTLMAAGEGGISTAHQVSVEAQSINPSHTGFLDPIHTPECYDEATEVFTESGWKRWADITDDDRLACRQEGELCFEAPTALHVSHYKGVMYGCRAGKIDYLVTPNHRMLVSTPWRPDVWRIIGVLGVHGKERRFDCKHEPYVPRLPVAEFELPPVSGNNSVKLVGRIPMELWAEFMGWFLSEGSCTYNEETSSYLVRHHQSKSASPDNYQRILGLTDRLPWSWSEESKRTSFATGSKQLASYLRGLGKAKEKFIPEYFFNASVGAREALLETLLLGDGRIGSNRKDGRSYEQEVYTTTSRRLAEDVERLAIGLGHSASVRTYEDRREERYLDVHEVRLLKHRYRTARPSHPNYPANFYKVDYDGTVYCATVPGGLLYVRRGDGVGFWCGNSEKTGVVLQLASGVKKVGKDLRIRAYNTKSKKVEWIDPVTAVSSVVAFPDQYNWKGDRPTPTGKSVKVSDKEGTITMLPPSKVDYVLSSTKGMFDVSANMIPFLQSNQGNRTMVASKQLEQAVPLLHREAPLVQTKGDRERTFEEGMGAFNSHISPVNGVVKQVRKEGVIIHGDDGERHEVQLYSDFPLNDSRSVLNSSAVVKAGDKVKRGQVVADTNFTKDGLLALGTNLRVAYTPYKGYNFEDGIIISEGAAKKLTSEHMHREAIRKESNIVMHKNKFLAASAGTVSKEQANKLDDDGVIREGEVVQPGDILIGALRKEEVRPEEQKIALFSKRLLKPVRPRPQKWTNETPGVVNRVVKHGKDITVHVKSFSPATIGDKIVGRHGNKGIITNILPDHEMPHDKSGKPMDVLLNPTGVPSRINLGQVMETAASKIANKTGKPYVVNNFDPDNKDYTRNLIKELESHGISDTEDLIDPLTNRKFKNVLVGDQYILKLHHMAEKGLQVRSRDKYDSNMTPKEGGPTGGQTMDALGLYALLAHNARHNIREFQSYKSDYNDSFWTAIQAGDPIPPPKVPFVHKKFEGYLKSMGTDIIKDGNSLVLGPITDKKIKEMSGGRVIKDPKLMLRAKDAAPEPGGLFDFKATGTTSGVNLGDKWAHFPLAERMPSPFFEKPIRSLLGLKENDFKAVIAGEKEFEGKTGPAAIVEGIKKIDIKKHLDETEPQLKKLKGTALNKANKKVKYLKTLQSLKMSPEEAYTTQLVPVMPPTMRPYTVLDDGSIKYDDVSEVYKHIGATNDQLERFDPAMLDEDKLKLQQELYDGLKGLALTGVTSHGRHFSGIAETIAGKQAKEGFFQKKVIGRRQDLSLRGTIVPEPSLSLDEVAIPRKAALELYKPFTVRRLVRLGYTPLEAQRQVNQNTSIAKQALEVEVSERPVLMKRDPVLHKFGVQAFKPVLTEGKAIKIHPLVTGGYNADFDGDKMSAYVPVSQKAVREAYNMMPSRNLFSPAHGKVMFKPGQEAQMGLFKLTELGKNGGKKFDDLSTLSKALQKGEVDMNEVVSLGSLGGDINIKLAARALKTTAGRLAIFKSLPPELRDEKILVDPKFSLDKSQLSSLLSDVAGRSPHDFPATADSLKDMGNAFSTGMSISLKDFVSDKEVRDPILARAAEKEAKIRASAASSAKKDAAVVDLYVRAAEEIDKSAKPRAEKSGNRMYDWIRSGARGNWDQYKQMTLAPVLVADSKGNPVPIPITKSYSEGQDIGSYWATMHGARMGTIGRAQGTREPGKLSKQMSNVSMRQVIVDEDCGATKGIRLSINDRDVLGRYTSEPISLGVRGGKDKGTIPAGTLVDTAVLNRIKNNRPGDSTVRVRTPLRCRHGDGMCARCFGLNENGQLHEPGANVGIMAAHALGEPATQLAMNCNAAGNLVTVRVEYNTNTMTFEEFWDSVPSFVDVKDGVETKVPLDAEIWDHDRFVPVLTIQRHKPSAKMVLVRTESGRTLVVEGDHPMWARSAVPVCSSTWCDCEEPVRFVGHYKEGSKTSVRCSKCHQPFQIPCEEYELQQERVVRAADLEGFYVGVSDAVRDGAPHEGPPLPPYLLGIYVSDGNVRRTKNTRKPKLGSKKRQTSPYGLFWKPLGVCFAQNQGEVRDRILEALKANDISYTENSYTENSEKDITLHDVGLARELWSKCGTGSHAIHLPKDWTTWGREELKLVLAGILDGNGASNDGDPQLDTTSWALASQVAEIVRTLGGYACIYDTKCREASAHQGYRVSIKLGCHLPSVKGFEKCSSLPCPEEGSYSKVVSVKEVEYEGWTYDVSTPSRAFSSNGVRNHNSFHTGGIVGAKGTSMNQFNRLNQLLKVPARLPGSATLASTDGTVEAIKKDPAGGWNVMINGERHYVPQRRQLTVKKGSTVRKGESLSTGPKNPRELLKYTNMGAVQRYITDEIYDIYKNEGPVKRRNVETFVRAFTNLGQVTDPGDHPEFLPGDKVPVSEVNAFNEKLKGSARPVKVEPLLKSIEHLPRDLETDWIARMNAGYLKQTLIDAAAEGWKSRVHSTHPIPAMAVAHEFGLGTRDSPYLY